jgi:hypothetical protein
MRRPDLLDYFCFSILAASSGLLVYETIRELLLRWHLLLK